MNSKALKTFQIVLAIIALVYFVMPDLVIGPFDDAAVAGLILVAEIVLAILQARSRSSDPGQTSNNRNYQYSEKNTYSGNTDNQRTYQEKDPTHDSDKKDNEFEFFAGCNDWEAVKTRYRDLMKIYHPDAGGNEEASKKINAEYNILKERFGRK